MSEINQMNQLPFEPAKHLERLERPGMWRYSAARVMGEKLRDAMRGDRDFYFFSPDETTSNRLDAVFEVTERAWLMPILAQDLPAGAEGRVVELLSENVLFSCMVGHVLSGGRGVMASYEAFFTIITSQILQYLKFVAQSRAVNWREPRAAVNLLSTSTCWRQDHNGFSHQSPALISTLLAVPGGRANCLFPADAVAAGVAFDFMQVGRDEVNLVTFNKSEELVWMDSNHARFQLENGGASIFGFASDGDFVDEEEMFDWREIERYYGVGVDYFSENGITVDRFAGVEGGVEDLEEKGAREGDGVREAEGRNAKVEGEAGNTGGRDVKVEEIGRPRSFVFTAAGDIASREALLAIKILREDLPGVRMRFVGIGALSHGRIGTVERGLEQAIFDEYFGQNAPIIANFHGYPADLRNILGNYTDARRVSVHGYVERGGTTTPFEMLAMNGASRYDLCIDVARACGREDLTRKYQEILVRNREFARENGVDLAEIAEFGWES